MSLSPQQMAAARVCRHYPTVPPQDIYAEAHALALEHSEKVSGYLYSTVYYRLNDFCKEEIAMGMDVASNSALEWLSMEDRSYERTELLADIDHQLSLDARELLSTLFLGGISLTSNRKEVTKTALVMHMKEKGLPERHARIVLKEIQSWWRNRNA